ncbi:hypothetical protein B0T22DRAFT_492095 [Podospora appendiculata]|uniref:Uncharacterized protein n=1 Tax=Podospora appendiculata TaxID=314037 RepID=A0AAE1C9Z9_9PEZI|nr:hypothetical protein B0T22DRAFT_492095 [Podospora appendiculata]
MCSVPSTADDSDSDWIEICVIIGLIFVIFLPIALTYLYRDRQRKNAILQTQAARDIELSRPRKRSPMSSAPELLSSELEDPIAMLHEAGGRPLLPRPVELEGGLRAGGRLGNGSARDAY